MNKKDLINKTVEVLKDNDIRKRVSAQKTVFHISDDNGNESDFIIRKAEKGLLFTSNDVCAIVDACLAVIEDSIKRGESINLHGFGTFSLGKRAERQTKHPATGEPVIISSRYVPKFNFGNNLRMAAKVYEMSLTDRESGRESGE